MGTALEDRDHPVTMEFVQILATLEMQSDPETSFPKYDEAHKEAWEKARDDYLTAFDRKIVDHMSAMARSLQNKSGTARSVSVSQLLQSDVALTPATKAQLRQMLVASWDSLPLRKRNELIQYRWSQVGGLELMPILRAIVAGEPNRNHDIDKPDRASALRWIYELAPDEGRELILREIANPQGDIRIEVLGLLAERELPQIEQPLITKLQEGNGSDIDFQLLERYGSLRALPDIKAIYEHHLGEWACAPQDALLRYLLRVEPEYGIARVSDALGYRRTTGCYKFQLTRLYEDIRRPKLEEIAIDALDDPSPEVTTDAAQALAKYGSPRAEQALWERLEKFHDKWKNSQDELHWRPGVQPDLQAEIRLEQVLVQAITNGQAWFATENTITRLKELASPQVESELDGVLHEIRSGDYALNLNWWPEGNLNYTVGRYSGRGMPELKEKLAQLPLGTHLNLITTRAERDHHLREFVDVEDAAAVDGLVLQIQTPR